MPLPACGREHCEVCDAELPTSRTPRHRWHPVVCERADCRLVAATARPEFRCRHCSRLVALARRGREHCGRASCERAYFEGVLRKEAQRRTDHLDAMMRERETVLRRQRHHHVDAARVATGLVPRSEHTTRPLSTRRRRAFQTHLQRMLDAAREALPNPAPAPPSSVPIGPQYAGYASLPPQAHALLGAACAACRGWCCSQWGGTTAFIKPDTMRDARARWPDASDAEIIAAYTAHLPTRSASPGCVYQGAKGCTLPRAWRGSECNRYLCDGLRMLADRIADGGDAGVYVGHEEQRFAHRRTLRVLPVLSGPSTQERA